jgi:hypothetical protein
VRIANEKALRIYSMRIIAQACAPDFKHVSLEERRSKVPKLKIEEMESRCLFICL